MMSIQFTDLEQREAYGHQLKLFLPEMGELQKQLYEGEYDPFKYAPLFESNFVQVTKRGEVVDIHNQVTLVTLGIAATSPILPLPNVMLLARPMCDTCNYETSSPESLQLSRLFPLKFVKITINDMDQRQLKLKLANGRAFYLQLYAPPDRIDNLFERWVKLIYLLRPPSQEGGAEISYESRPTSASTMDQGHQIKMGAGPEKLESGELSSIKEEEVSQEKAEIKEESEDSPKSDELPENEKKPEEHVKKRSTVKSGSERSDTRKLAAKKGTKNRDSKKKSSRIRADTEGTEAAQKESKLSNLLRTLSKQSSSELSKPVEKKEKDSLKKKKK
ncbi:protein FAM71E1 [Rhinatrema bivittatum]|uniref:protein FAM71E1 n=1 Tax=Rhinatrema bivittatum TaxID=194408 RepID=UPI001128888D|nr:protein FAM71E1 [Rhinatrema bivittatum]XP_029441202.1 protein FAM71E1 [Rhinatrema bivittatum]